MIALQAEKLARFARRMSTLADLMNYYAKQCELAARLIRPSEADVALALDERARAFIESATSIRQALRDETPTMITPEFAHGYEAMNPPAQCGLCARIGTNDLGGPRVHSPSCKNQETNHA